MWRHFFITWNACRISHEDLWFFHQVVWLCSKFSEKIVTAIFRVTEDPKYHYLSNICHKSVNTYIMLDCFWITMTNWCLCNSRIQFESLWYSIMIIMTVSTEEDVRSEGGNNRRGELHKCKCIPGTSEAHWRTKDHSEDTSIQGNNNIKIAFEEIQWEGMDRFLWVSAGTSGRLL